MTWEGLTPPYATLVADPPWPIRWDGRAGGQRHFDSHMGYSTMTVDDIAALDVAQLAARDAHLFLWVTAALNRRGIGAHIAHAWGFRDVAEIIWEKPNIGTGAMPRACHEILLVCTRGTLGWVGPRNVRSVQHWPQDYSRKPGGRVGKTHSAKPAAALDLIERVSPAPRVELFARERRLGWDSWGYGYEGAAS